MQITYKDSIEDIRNYDGIPSVTGLLSLIEDPTFDMLKSNPDFERIMKAAADRGTAVHNFIEDTLQGKPCKIEDHKDFIKQFLIFNATFKYENVVLEKFHKGTNFAGTIDCIMEDKDGDIHIIDWKTAKQKPTGLMLEKYKMQLAGYFILTNSIATTASIVVFTEKDFYKIELSNYELYEYKREFEKLILHYKKLKDASTTS